MNKLVSELSRIKELEKKIEEGNKAVFEQQQILENKKRDLQDTSLKYLSAIVDFCKVFPIPLEKFRKKLESEFQEEGCYSSQMFTIPNIKLKISLNDLTNINSAGCFAYKLNNKGELEWFHNDSSDVKIRAKYFLQLFKTQYPDLKLAVQIIKQNINIARFVIPFDFNQKFSNDSKLEDNVSINYKVSSDQKSLSLTFTFYNADKILFSFPSNILKRQQIGPGVSLELIRGFLNEHINTYYNTNTI